MYIDTKAVDLRFDNTETKAVESDVRIKLRINSFRTNRIDSTVFDMYETGDRKIYNFHISFICASIFRCN